MAVARTVTRAAADWNVITVGSTLTRSPAPDTAGQRHTITRTRWNTQPLASGHLALCATARTFIFSNIDFHVSTRPPKFRVAAYSITAVNRGADRAVYSAATLISIPCLLVAMVVNLLPRTSLNLFTYYKY